MPGLRRLTLNGNPRLGDSAVSEIVDAVGDSLWLKALDLQHCGLTDAIRQEILDLLEYNKTLVVIDVRMNSNIRGDLVNDITRKLEENNNSGKSEYRWLVAMENDRRTSSAGTMGKSKYEDPIKGQMRAKSAIVRQKRPSQQTPCRRTPSTPTPQVVTRTKSKPPLPYSFRKREVQRQNIDISQVRSIPKTSIHLDLMEQLRSVADLTQNDAIVQEEPVVVRMIEDNAKREEDENAAKINEALSQLSEMRIERERLLEEIKNTEMMLAEERAQREIAEEKQHSTSYDLAELEEVLREKERESRGYLLVSQKSLDEICLSFDRLLEMLDCASRKPSLARVSSEEETIVREDIRRRIATILRKTKSENVRRGYFMDDDVITPRIETRNRFGRRSEGDVRTIVQPSIPVHFERHIGDSPDRIPLSIEPNYRELYVDDRLKKSETPGERARAIFARIMNGEAVFNLGTHVE